MITHIRSCCDSSKEEELKDMFLKCISSWFGSTLVINLKGLMCLNKEIVTNDFLFAAPSEIFKTGYNAEEPMSHHNT